MPTTAAGKKALRAELEAKLAKAELEEDAANELVDRAYAKLGSATGSVRATKKKEWEAEKVKAAVKKQEVAQIEASMTGLPEIPLVAPKSLAEFNRLPRSKKDAFVENLLAEIDDAPKGSSEHNGNKFTVIELKDWDEAVYDPFGKKILAAFKNDLQGDTDRPDGVATVGKPSATVRVVRLPDGTPVVGTVYVHQAGAFLEDGNGRHFATAAEATAAGYDTGADVAWSQSSSYNAKGNHRSGDTYWEWSGW